jgi:MFS family permease
VYEQTGKATPLAMTSFFYIVPMVILTPFIGVIVDRGNRKWLMMVSDLAAALTSLMVLLLLLGGRLEVWHLYVTNTVLGIFQGFHWPSYSASISLMLPKEHYARANGMLNLAGNASNVFAPMLAGALIGRIGLQGILLIDLATAAFAIGSLLFVHIPQPEKSEEDVSQQGGLWGQLTFGFRYIFARPSLLGLQLVLLLANFFASIRFVLIAPLVLGRTGSDEVLFGSVQSAGAIGGVAGGLAMSTWGGPKKRVSGLLTSWVLTGLLGMLALGAGRGLAVWAFGVFMFTFFDPIINGCNQAIWQSKVPPALQGRVFSARAFIAWSILPLSPLLAGPLADNVFEPAMSGGGWLASTFDWLVGTGPGAGVGLIFILFGLLTALVGLGGYLFPAVRNAEALLPDYDEGMD